MIVWKHKDAKACPECLVGCANVQSMAGMWWVAAPPIMPMDNLKWFEAANGWSVAISGEPEIESLIRELPWSMRLVVQDGRKRDWVIPAILGPQPLKHANRSAMQSLTTMRRRSLFYPCLNAPCIVMLPP